VNVVHTARSICLSHRKEEVMRKVEHTRVSREDVERAMREVHRKVPKNVKKTGKKAKAKEKMLRAIAFSKARRRL